MSHAANRKLRVGTSGWSYKDWVGPFYAEGTAAADYLPRYAERFSVVEVDSTFYGIPRRATVEGWRERTPESFRFAPKVPGAVTHGGEGQRPLPDRVLRDTDTLAAFLETMDALGERLGPIVFQFPYFKVGTLAPEDFRERLAAVLDSVPASLRTAVEIRNKTWVTADYLRLLESRRAAAVMIDHNYMPPPLHQLRVGMVTTDIAYIRLLGDRYGIEKVTKSWEKIVVDKGERLDDWAEVMRDLLDRPGVSTVYTFANNHFAGHGPATCRELLSRIGAA